MRLKILALTAGVITLTLTSTPFAVEAQPSFPAPQPPGSQPGIQGSPAQDPLEGLNLTNSQKKRIQNINRNSFNRIERVLNQKQKDRLRVAIQNGQSQPQAFASLNLSDRQRSQIQDIMQSSRQQVRDVLTPRQREQLRRYEEDPRSRRQPGGF